MAHKFHNFDAQFSEMRGEKLYFQLFGKEYWIYKRMPAIVPLEMARLEDDETVDTKTLMRTAYALFGEENLKEWSTNQGFTTDVVSEMIKWAFAAINGKDDEPTEITEDDGPEEKGKN